MHIYTYIYVYICVCVEDGFDSPLVAPAGRGRAKTAKAATVWVTRLLKK